ncbi:hypothetical protein QUA56_02215 [Microcoleus sp. N3A4]|uniref:hypothetical protein n=1 Tax=Microcoleus sp. N3A4 TaxID=3055379 RepID=UPI002FD2F5EE
MTKFYELLNRIQKKPAMYIGSRSISNLFMFLCGYQHARDLLEIPVTEQEKEFAEFQPWLQKKFALVTSASWAKIILFNSTDESHAFDNFFDLLEEFIKAKYPLNKAGDNQSAVLTLD